MLAVSTNCNSYKYNRCTPSFGSVVLSRVLLRTYDKKGNIFYTPIMNNERGIKGIYQSLSLQVNKVKNREILQKLSSVIKDFKINSPFVRSTIIGVRSRFKRFLLTGSDARLAKDLGTDLIGALNDRKTYSNFMKNEILNKPQKRIFNDSGDEIGIDLIVEGSRGARRLVDVEISTLQDISKAKPPGFVSNKSELKKLDNLQENFLTKSEGQQIQQEFDFVSDLKPKPINPRDYN